jgi:hypothetical protein
MGPAGQVAGRARVSHERSGAAIVTLAPVTSPVAQRRVRTLGAALGAGLCALVSATSARAQASARGDASVEAREDPIAERDRAAPARDPRALPRSPSLPDLSHPAAEGTFEQATAALTPKGGGEPVTAHLFQADVEVPIGGIVYVGGKYGVAAARAPASDGVRVISSQPELYARVVSLGLGRHYTLGAGLGIVPPLFDNGDALDRASTLAPATAAALAGIVRPWDVPLYLDRHLTMRPWIDMRTSRRHLVAQFRGMLDFALRTRGPSSGTATATATATAIGGAAGDLDMFGTAWLYLGWRPTPELSLGLEAWETYLLKTERPIADRDRITFALSPSVRWSFRWVEPAVSVLVPLGQPLFDTADRYVTLRVDVRVWFGRGRAIVDE